MTTTINQRIVATIAEFGPITSAEIAEHIGSTADCVSVQISKMRRIGAPGAPVIRSWIRSIGSGGGPKALWGILEPGEERADAKKPRREMKTTSARRWREKNRAVVLLKSRAKSGVPAWLAGLVPAWTPMRLRSGGRQE